MLKISTCVATALSIIQKLRQIREKLKFNNKTFFKSEIKFSQAKVFFGAAKKNILVFVITFKGNERIVG